RIAGRAAAAAGKRRRFGTGELVPDAEAIRHRRALALGNDPRLATRAGVDGRVVVALDLCVEMTSSAAAARGQGENQDRGESHRAPIPRTGCTPADILRQRPATDRAAQCASRAM